MKVPKKVYIDDFGSGFSHGWHTEHSYENDIEYVRKDSFIEKACEWLKKNCKNYSSNALGEEYLIDDFKKAMKGE